jgi:glutamine amidotransferase
MAERVAVIDYGAGNLRSVAKAVEAASEGVVTVLVANSAQTVATADRIVLPGVGAFGQCAAALRAVPDMQETLSRRVLENGVPFLGVCVGMQLLARRGSEHGSHQGLGWIPGEVVRLQPEDPMLKVPHMGWNPVMLRLDGTKHPVTGQLESSGQAYFVHSYHFQPADSAHLLATSDYGGAFAAIVGRDNILGVQFHPEKSQAFGLGFLRAFLGWKP